VLAVIGCGGAPTAEPRLAANVGKPLTKRALLRYDIRGRPFPLPIVSGTIAGQPVLMLVDTGANSHVIAGWLARKLKLPMKKLGDIGTDHVGNPIATYRLEKVDVAVDDWGKLSTGTLLATEVPEVIEKLGIGAFISPQRLDEEGDSVVLDLAKGELRSAWFDEQQKAMSESGTPFLELDSARTCDDSDGPIRGLAYVVPSNIESQKVSLLIDTGAQHSDIFASSTPGQRLVAQSTLNKEAMYTASGKVQARTLKSAHITTGSFAVTSDVGLIQGAPDASCARDGVLAMDVLRSCTLLLGRTRVYGRCLVPK
jgi:hypothetical protein